MQTVMSSPIAETPSSPPSSPPSIMESTMESTDKSQSPELRHRHAHHEEDGAHSIQDKSHKLGTLSCVSLITNKMLGTGLFSTPAIIFRYVNANVTLYLSLWLVGAIVVFSGLKIYLEYALNLPFKNGGEKNYLLRVFRNPRGLAGCVYAFQMVLLGFSSGNSFAFGKYVYFALMQQREGVHDDGWQVKCLGVACITFCIWLHVKFPNHGTRLFNVLGVIKILVLVLIIVLGLLVALGVIVVENNDDPQVADLVLQQVAQQHHGFYSISVALLEIIYSFKGWENANYVLSEISDPFHVLTVAAPLAVAIVTLLYFLVIISYLIVIPKHELLNSGVLVAGIFFNKIFGEGFTSTLLPLLIALSTLGNVMVVSFAHSYVNQELSRNNYLPFAKYFENINHSLLLHWFVTVVVMVAPPSSEIYEFVVNLYIYPGTWINLFITAGLIYLRLNMKREKWGGFNPRFKAAGETPANPVEELNEYLGPETANVPGDNHSQSSSTFTEFDSLLSLEDQAQPSEAGSKFTASYFCIIVFLLANLFLAILPFVPPNDNPSSIPYWCFPVVGTGVLVMGGVFFYSRQWAHNYTYKKWGIGNTDIKYEQDYNPSLGEL